MSLRSAKAKRKKITAEQERRRRAAWERRFATDMRHAAERAHRTEERLEQCLQLLRILEARTRPATPELSFSSGCVNADELRERFGLSKRSAI